MTIVAAWPRLMSPDLAETYVGGKKVLDDLTEKRLVRPRCQGKGFTRYDRAELDAALDAWGGFDEQ